MAKLNTALILSSLCIFMIWADVTARDLPVEDWIQNLTRRNEKFVHLHFFVQDALGGPNQTVFEVARGNITSTSQTGFGRVTVIDDLLTAQPDRNSTKLGRVQGTIASSDLAELGLTMTLNFYFNTGVYNGSTLCLLGRNPFLSANRELPIVAGTGVFRMARGYSISNTYSFDPVENYDVLEYNVYVAFME